MKKIIFLAACVLPFFSMAQDTLKCETVAKERSNITGTVLKGVVADVQDYKPLDDVQVTLVAKTNDVTRSAETDSKGNFFFKEIPAGEYAIRFERDGYRTFNYDAVFVNEGKTCSLGFPLYRK